MKFSIQSLGCKINQFDADALRERLAAGGAREAADGEQADVSIVFTCTVTKKSDYQCRQAIRRAVGKKAPGGLVVVAGCYAQTDPAAIREIPGVDIVAGNGGLDALPELILGKRTAEAAGDGLKALAVGGRSRAFLKVQEGCGSRCSYCIVPAARGVPRSAAPEDVLQRADALIAQGYHEIVLTGVHLGQYGTDLGGGDSLPRLVGRLLERPGLGRLRLSSVEPTEIGGGLMELLSHGKLCRHFHIPLQSADDPVLLSMRRGYTAEEYFDVIGKVAEKAPGACIGADVIVGYPAEDGESFRKTFERIEDSPINHLHVFSYSPRPGTEAYSLGDPVRGDEKRRRSLMLREMAADKNRTFKKGFVGKELTAVVEEKAGGTSGLTDNYIRVEFGGGARPKDAVRVRLVEVNDKTCRGELV